jgi:hypothetical protein
MQKLLLQQPETITVLVQIESLEIAVVTITCLFTILPLGIAIALLTRARRSLIVHIIPQGTKLMPLTRRQLRRLQLQGCMVQGLELQELQEQLVEPRQARQVVQGLELQELPRQPQPWCANLPSADRDQDTARQQMVLDQ